MKIIKDLCQKLKNKKIKTNRANNNTTLRIKNKTFIGNKIR